MRASFGGLDQPEKQVHQHGFPTPNTAPYIKTIWRLWRLAKQPTAFDGFGHDGADTLQFIQHVLLCGVMVKFTCGDPVAVCFLDGHGVVIAVQNGVEKVRQHRRRSQMIRRPNLEDIETLSRIHVQAWDEAYRGLLPDSEIAARDLTFRRALWPKLITNPDLRIAYAPNVGFAVMGQQRARRLPRKNTTRSLAAFTY